MLLYKIRVDLNNISATLLNGLKLTFLISDQGVPEHGRIVEIKIKMKYTVNVSIYTKLVVEM